ncbi:MAG: 5-dehydro-2-deoxygluconokinase [Actinomycetota bacterium]
MPAPPLEVLTIGRVSVDVYPDQPGPLEDVETFRTYLGGSPTNVAVAAARHDRRSAVVTAVGADPFGRIVRRELHRYGVDDRFLLERPGHQTPLAFCEMFPPDSFPLYFYRHRAPDLTITPADVDTDAVRTAGVFWATVTGLCAEPSRTATLEALRARDGAGLTVLDLDYRPMLWDSPTTAHRAVRAAMPHVNVLVGNLDEYEVAVGTRDPKAAAYAAREAGDDGFRVAVVKRGPDGVLALDADDEVVDVPAIPVPVVNGLGAGDAFGGALCHGLLGGWPLERALRFANAAGAYVTTQVACSAAMPTTEQVHALLREAGDDR